MRARVIDPIGPFWLRAAVPLLGVLIAIAGGVLTGMTGSVGVLCAGLALALGGSVLVPRLRARYAEITLGDGWIDVGGPLPRRIRARSVRAATSARTERGVAVALTTRFRHNRPIVLEVASDEEA